MIHYTLLPEKEIRTLKREYRTRLFITLLFFVCFAVLVGLVSLLPAYLFSSFQEKEALSNLDSIKEERQDNEASEISKELVLVNDLVKKIKSNQNSFIPSDLITRVILEKTPGISLTAFQISGSTESNKNSTTTTTLIVIQGGALSRESLINFKSNLEANPLFTKVELPVSDLTKSKNIPFSIRLSIITKK
jgi:hypothetical protein